MLRNVLEGVIHINARYALFLGAVILTLILSIAFAEVYVRSTRPYWDLDMAMKYSPSVFSRHVISRKKQVVRRRADPSDTIGINEFGYRGDSFRRQKPDDEIRIMIYGGSQVFSAGTGAQGWPARLEGVLMELGFSSVEVINAGVPGHASFDSLGRLVSYGHYFEPDLVVLNNAWNDIKYFHIPKHPLSRARPYNPGMNPRRNYVNWFDKFLGQNSQFYLLLRTKYFSWIFDPRRSSDFYSERTHRAISKEALQQYRLTVETFVNVVKTIGAKPVLMKQPRLLVENLPEKTAGKIRFNVQNLTPGATLKAYEKIDRILESVARETDAKLYTSDGINGSGDYFYDHVHLNSRGAKKLASDLAGKISEILTEQKR